MEYKTIRSDRSSVSIQIKNGEVVVRVSKDMPSSSVEVIVSGHRSWIEKKLEEQKGFKETADALPEFTNEDIEKLMDEAAEYIPKRVDYYAKIMGLSYNKITINNYRSRWGTSSNRHNLSFNCLLMLAPKEVLDSIVVHELCHFKDLSHSRAFYALVEKYYPDYWECQRWLDDEGLLLISRLGKCKRVKRDVN